jgi:hypothetical protein
MNIPYSYCVTGCDRCDPSIVAISGEGEAICACALDAKETPEMKPASHPRAINPAPPLLNNSDFIENIGGPPVESAEDHPSRFKWSDEVESGRELEWSLGA